MSHKWTDRNAFCIQIFMVLPFTCRLLCQCTSFCLMKILFCIKHIYTIRTTTGQRNQKIIKFLLNKESSLLQQKKWNCRFLCFSMLNLDHIWYLYNTKMKSYNQNNNNKIYVFLMRNIFNIFVI